MPQKYYSTGVNRNFTNIINRLENWAYNPWRRYSLLLIIFLAAFALGSSIGMINGVLALMDPVGAFFTVVIIEIMIRLRRNLSLRKKRYLVLQIIDMARIGLVYGLFMEGFKLF